MFKALDETGKKIKFKARGFLARVLQHETDHLNGLAIKDRAKYKVKNLPFDPVAKRSQRS